MSISIVWTQANGQIGELVLDAVMGQSHDINSTPTKNPVEEGSQVTDHVQLEPIELSIDGAVSATPVQQVTNGTQYPLGQPGRNKDAFDTLRRLRDERTLVSVVAPPYAQYTSMLVKSVTVPDQQTDTLHFTVKLVELRIVRTQLVQLPKSKNSRGKGGPTNKGTKGGEQKQEDQSVLKDITDALSSKDKDGNRTGLMGFLSNRATSFSYLK